MELFLKVFQMNHKLLQFWSLCLDFLLSRNNLFYFGTILSMQWKQSLPLTSSSSPQIPSLERLTSTSFSCILLKTFFAYTHIFFSQIIIYHTHTSGLSFFLHTRTWWTWLHTSIYGSVSLLNMTIQNPTIWTYYNFFSLSTIIGQLKLL